MENEYFKFNPGTHTCRTPMPTRFEHFLKFITKEENFLGLHSQTDITNINQQLDQTLNLMISNIIQRVIAQVIGQTDAGFVTIKGTDDGALHVYLAGTAATLDILATLQAGANLIGKVQIEGPAHTEQRAIISFATIATHDITLAAPTGSYHITSIMFTVDGDVGIILRDESGVISGPMSFGGTNEPRGMAHNFGQIPLKCSAGKKFQMTLDASIQVCGVVTFYDA